MNRITKRWPYALALVSGLACGLATLGCNLWWLAILSFSGLYLSLQCCLASGRPNSLLPPLPSSRRTPGPTPDQSNHSLAPRERPPRRRTGSGPIFKPALVGWLFSAGQFGVGTFWVHEFTLPGMILLVIIESLFLTFTLALLSLRRRSRVVANATPGMTVGGFVFAIVLAEFVRWREPFGGVPLANAALTQVNGPLLQVAWFGGPLGVIAVTAYLGAALPLAIVRFRRKQWLPFAAGVITATAVLLIAVFLNQPTTPGSGSSSAFINVAIVQGGGEIGTRAIETDPQTIFDAHLDATEQLIGANPKPDLVVWPENVITVSDAQNEADVFGFMSALAIELDAPITAGVTGKVNDKQFINQQVLWDAQGNLVARYDKVKRVPFGEYVPFRNLVRKFADLSAVPRDAIPGHKPGQFDIKYGESSTRVQVLVSYDVFFAGLAQQGSTSGIVVVATNSASYHSKVVTEQTLAAARLQAVQLGRNVVLASPTGVSAFIDASGKPTAITARKESRVLQQSVEIHEGSTLAVWLGDAGVLAVFALLALVSGAVSYMRYPSHNVFTSEASPLEEATALD